MSLEFFEIPLINSLDNWVETIALSNKLYKFAFQFNDVSSQWFLSIYDIDNNLLVGSIAVVIGSNLISNYDYDTNLPPGVLYVANIIDQKSDATETNFGVDVVLVYAVDN